MQKTFFVLGITLICLFAQLLCAKVFGSWCVPNFVLIAVVFFNLYRGLRYSLGAAFLGGFLLDSFGGTIVGINIFSLVMCAFVTSTLKMYIYQPGVSESRVVVVLVAIGLNSFLQYFINIVMGIDIRLGDAFWKVILPEIILTTLVASYTLERLKQCALKLFS